MNRRNVNEHFLRQESAKLPCGIDDLLLFMEGGKHDYDWLLTPPRTPDFPSSKGKSQQTLVPPTPRSSLGRSTTNTNISKVSASNNQSRPATRSSSVSRPTISSSMRNTYSSNRSSSILKNRPSSPIIGSPSAIRSSTPLRPSTPSRAPSPAGKSRPSTPTSRPANSHPSSSRSPSRPSTPTRRHLLPSPSPTTASLSTGPLNGRNSRPQLLVVPPDFPLETPPNLRTTLPHRPVSAGRSRPGANSATLKPNPDTQASVTSMSRRNGRVPQGSEVMTRISVKAPTSVTENNGFGRAISKKSLDMALRHMDTRNSSGTVRSLPSPTLFPQSVRTLTPKAKTLQVQSARSSAPANSVGNDINGSLQTRNNRMIGRGREIDHERQHFAKLREVDMYHYQSSRHDALLLKDWRNTNWLHSGDEKCDQGHIFDKEFESLLESFALS